MEGNPYIEEKDRPKYRDILRQLPDIKTKGDLEYCVTCLQKLFMEGKPWRFVTIHDAVYGPIHCGDEFRRRYLDPRENQARETNGDVLPKIKPPWEEE